MDDLSKIHVCSETVKHNPLRGRSLVRSALRVVVFFTLHNSGIDMSYLFSSGFHFTLCQSMKECENALRNKLLSWWLLGDISPGALLKFQRKWKLAIAPHRPRVYVLVCCLLYNA